MSEPDIVYLIQAHQNPEVFGRLLSGLDGARAFVHIDAKTDPMPFRAMARQYGRAITFVTDPVSVWWAGFSQVDAALTLLRAALPTVGDDDYVALVSGDTLPVRPRSEIRRFLAESDGTQFVHAVEMPAPGTEDLPPFAFASLGRLSRMQFETRRTPIREPIVRFLNKVRVPRPFRGALRGRTPFNGSQWWALTGAAAKWVLADADADRRFVRYCHTMTCPDEFFFQTLVMNSPFGQKVRPTPMFVDWGDGTSWSPIPISLEHTERLRALVASDAVDSTVLFARKVPDAAVADAVRAEVWPAAVAR